MKLKTTTLLMVLFIFIENVKAQKFPFRKTDKGPYGTYVLYDQLSNLFPNTAFTLNHKNPASKFRFDYATNKGYFIIAPYVSFGDGEIEVLNNFLAKGNVMVISTYFLHPKVEEWLGVELSLYDETVKKDGIQLLNLESSNFDDFILGKRAYKMFISRYDSTTAEFSILGRYNEHSPNCIIFKKTNGFVVLHTQPYMFTNYHLIKKRTKAYSEIFFSSLPGPLSEIVWDEYYKGSRSEMEPLRFIMSSAALRSAFWWAIAGLLMLVFLSFKRRQRIMPVMEPNINNTVDMVRTVSDMYFFSRRNEIMAKKKIAHWLEFLRAKYNILPGIAPDAFWQSVHMRSGMSEEKVGMLRVMVEIYRNGDEKITDMQLLQLNSLIDSFYKS